MAAMVLPLRRSGIAILGMIPWGAHICMFYETKEDLLDPHADYFGAGLQDNEFCLWVISDPITEQEARAALTQSLPDFDRYVAEGRFEFLSGREWYLSAEKFDPNRINGNLYEKLRGALAKGFAGMRVSGNVSWLIANYWTDFREYEHELVRSLAGQSMVVLCTYSLDASRGIDLLDVANAHGVTVARRQGAWEIVEAFEVTADRGALTDRELEALTWVARGKSAWEIGRILQISKRTVDEHVQRATRKLGATNRTQAAAIAIRDRIIDPSAPSR